MELSDQNFKATIIKCFNKLLQILLEQIKRQKISAKKKKLITLKKQMKSIELKNVISEIKTYLMGSVTEWRSKRLESLYLRVDQDNLFMLNNKKKKD